MPRYQTVDSDGDNVVRYRWPAQYELGPDADVVYESLKAWRKQAIKDREEFLGYQKTCGQQDQDGARFFKECANREMRRQRACTYMLPYFGEPDAKQEIVRPILWPVDLEAELDEIAYRIIVLRREGLPIAPSAPKATQAALSGVRAMIGISIGSFYWALRSPWSPAYFHERAGAIDVYPLVFGWRITRQPKTGIVPL